MMSSRCRQLVPALVLVLVGGAAALYAQSRPAPSSQPASAAGQPPTASGQPSTAAGQPSAATGATTTTPPRPAPRLWWKDEDFRRQLNLSEGQVAQIDKIYKDTRPQQEGRMVELTRLETELSVLMKKNDAVEKVTIKVDQVEAMRAAMNKARTLMLYEMRRVMSMPQRQRFDELFADWRKEQERLRDEQNRKDEQSRKDEQNRKADQKPDSRSEPRTRF
jgi:hypothetical protein